MNYSTQLLSQSSRHWRFYTLLLFLVLSWRSSAQSSVQLDGTDDYISLGSDPTLSLANQHVTLEAWINVPADATGQSTIVGKYDIDNSSMEYLLRLSDLNLSFLVDNGSVQEVASTVQLTNDVWHHVAGTYDGTDLRIFVDGVEAGVLNAPGSVIELNAIETLIGSSSPEVEVFMGMIDEVRIWREAHNVSELQALKDVQLRGDEYGLIAYYSFDNEEDFGLSNVTDGTTNGNNGALINMDVQTAWVDGAAVEPAMTCGTINITPNSVANTLCVGVNGSVSIGSSIDEGEPSAYRYKFYSSTVPDPAFLIQSTEVTNGATGFTFTGLASGDYTVEVINLDNQCFTNTVVAVNDELVSPTISTELVLVTPDLGASDGSLDAAEAITDGSGDYSYSWHQGTSTTGGVVGATDAILGLIADDYTLVVTDNVSDCESAPAIFSVGTYVSTGYPNALNFDGTNTPFDYIETPHNSAMNLAQSDFTLESWVYLTQSGANETIISKGDGSGAATEFSLQIQSQQIALSLSDGTTLESALGTSTIPLNEWHHVAVAYVTTSNTSQFYLDGVSDGSHNYSLTPISTGDTNPQFIGKLGYSCDCDYFDGSMDDLRVWDIARTAADISANMQTSLYGETNLIASYDFNDGVISADNSMHNYLLDVSGNGNNGELINFNLTGTTSNWVGSYGSVRTVQDGNWSDAATWGGAMPAATDNVEILHLVTLDQSVADVQDFFLISGDLNLNGNTLQVAGDFVKSLESTLTDNDGVIVLNGDNQRFHQVGATNFGTLIFGGTGTVTIDCASGDDIIIADTIRIGTGLGVVFTDYPDVVLTEDAVFENNGSISSEFKWNLVSDGTEHTVLGGDFYSVSYQNASTISLVGDFNYDFDLSSNQLGAIFNMDVYNVNLGEFFNFYVEDSLGYEASSQLLADNPVSSFSAQGVPLPFLNVNLVAGELFIFNTMVSFDTDKYLVVDQGDVSFKGGRFDGTSGGVTVNGGSLTMDQSSLYLNNGAQLVVSGGIVNINGLDDLEGSPAVISSEVGSFDITLGSGALNLYVAEITGSRNNGISVGGGDFLMDKVNFSGGTGNAYITFLANIEEKTYNDITFDSGPTNNVVISDEIDQVVNFYNWAGDFAGSDYHYQGNIGLINWGAPEPVSYFEDFNTYSGDIDIEVSGDFPFTQATWTLNNATVTSEAAVVFGGSGYAIRLSNTGDFITSFQVEGIGSFDIGYRSYAGSEASFQLEYSDGTTPIQLDPVSTLSTTFENYHYDFTEPFTGTLTITLLASSDALIIDDVYFNAPVETRGKIVESFESLNAQQYDGPVSLTTGEWQFNSTSGQTGTVYEGTYAVELSYANAASLTTHYFDGETPVRFWYNGTDAQFSVSVTVDEGTPSEVANITANTGEWTQYEYLPAFTGSQITVSITVDDISSTSNLFIDEFEFGENEPVINDLVVDAQETTLTLEVGAGTASNIYYVITRSVSVPTIDQIVAGTDENDVQAEVSGLITGVESGVTYTLGDTNWGANDLPLDDANTYYLFLVSSDGTNYSTEYPVWLTTNAMPGGIQTDESFDSFSGNLNESSTGTFTFVNESLNLSNVLVTDNTTLVAGNVGYALELSDAGDYFETMELTDIIKFGFQWRSNTGDQVYVKVSTSADGTTYSELFTASTASASYEPVSYSFDSNFNGFIRVEVSQTASTTLLIDDAYYQNPATPQATVTIATEELTAGLLEAGTTNNLIYKMKLSVTEADALIEGLIIVPSDSTSGEYRQSDFTNFHLYESINVDDLSNAALLGSTFFAPSGDAQIPEGAIGWYISSTYVVGDEVFLYIVADMSSEGTPQGDFYINLPNLQTDFGFGDSQLVDGGLNQSGSYTLTQAPVISGDVSISVPENSLAITTYAADQEVNWSLNGVDAGLFQIETDGSLSFIGGPDFEEPTDDGLDNIYTLEVIASNLSALTDTVLVEVTITDDNDNAPIIDDPGALTVSENTALDTELLTLTFTDADVSSATHDWSIVAGNTDIDGDSNLPFGIDVSLGVLTVTDSSDLDFELKTSFSLSVRVFDGLNADTLVLAVSIQDVEEDDVAPVITAPEILTNDISPEISGTVDEPDAAISLIIAGTTYPAVNNGDNTWTLSQGTIADLAEGTYTYSAVVTDLQDNSATVEAILVIDLTAPVVSVNSVSTEGDSPELNGDIDDSDAIIVVIVDGTEYTGVNHGDGSWTLPEGMLAPLPVGIYDVFVRAEDLAGNQGTDNTSSELEILPEAPVALEAGEVTTGGFTAQWNTREGALSYKFDAASDMFFVNLLSGFNDLVVSDTSVLVSGLNYGTTYYYRVRAVYESDVISPNSEVIAVTTLTDPATVADSLALVALYTSLRGPEWVSNNWEEEVSLREWSGVTMTDTRVTALDLSSTNLEGTFPALTSGLDALETMNLRDNELLDFADDLSTLTSLASLDVGKNRLQFGALEQLRFSPILLEQMKSDSQKVVLTPIRTLEEIGSTYTIDRAVTGSGNSYTWTKNGDPINQTGTSFTLAINDYSVDGIYEAEVTNSFFPSLVLKTQPVIVRVSSLERDSASLVTIYDALEGQNSSLTSWKTLPVAEWTEVTITDSRVSAINLSNAGLTGALPIDIVDISGLVTVDLSGNNIFGLPNLTGSLPNLTSFNVSGNLLTFEDLEMNTGVTGINYADQQNIGEEQEDVIPVGTPYSISLPVGGTVNNYTWKLENALGSQALGETSSDLSIDAIGYETMGSYTLEITNDLVPGLTLSTKPYRVLASANLSFLALDQSEDPFVNGLAHALLVREEGQAYDTIQSIEPTGNSFLFSELILGDYLIALAPNTNSEFLITYYAGTDLWLEADTLLLRGNLSDSLAMQFTPGAVGQGGTSGATVSGNVVSEFEDDDEGGRSARILARRNVKRAGCSVRRFVPRGRTDQEDGVFELYAYVESDDEGKFEFTELEDGTYRFNVEYPGIPMDPDSDIEFVIGEGGIEEETFVLTATITEDGISVQRTESPTGIYRKYFKDLNVYPNPTSDYLRITYKRLLSDEVTMQLMDLAGNTVKESKAIQTYDGAYQMDVSDVSSGFYLLNFVDPGMRSGQITAFKIFIRR